MQTTKLETTAETAMNMGLTAEEFEKIGELLGRTPNPAELYIYAVMWSEECCQKSSIKWLKTLPREGKHLIHGPNGDGLVDIGNGLACAFKIEPDFHSGHNFPKGSGAAFTGMHHNIVALGARPVAVLHSLHFGDPNLADTAKNFSEALKNTKRTGERTGVPNLGNEVFFQTNQEISLDTLSVGVVETDKIVSPHSGAPGNPVYLVGFDAPGQNSDENSTVEITEKENGASFPEQRLIAACLEFAQSEAIAGMQHITTSGIAFSAAQLSAKDGLGMAIDLDKIPTSKEVEDKWEILLSGGAGLMMLAAKAGEEDVLFEIFEKWEVSFAQIGEVTDKGTLELLHCSEKLAVLPVGTLLTGGGAPIYDHQSVKPEYLKKVRQFQLRQIKTPKDYIKAARQLWASPNLGFRNWFFEKNASLNQAEEEAPNDLCDASAIKLNEADDRTLLINLGGNAAYVFADPYAGAAIAVAEAARRIYCAGGIPVAITGGLKFGDLSEPEVYFQFTNATKGMGDACRKFDISVSSCEVSLSEKNTNGDAAKPAFPTPNIGMIGILEAPEDLTSIGYKNEGDCIYLIGNSENDLGSSEYLCTVLGVHYSPAPGFEPHEEIEIYEHVRKLIRMKIVASAHSVSMGGLFINLLESALAGGLGFSIETVETFRKDCFLFGESQSRAVVSISPEHEDKLLNYLISNNVSFTKLGEVLGKDALIDDKNFGSINDWKTVNDNKFDIILERKDS